jgi:hypothetical protein
VTYGRRVGRLATVAAFAAALALASGSPAHADTGCTYEHPERCVGTVTIATGGCIVDVGYCEDGGQCTVNVGYCTASGRCTVNVGYCKDGTIFQT